MQFVKRSSVKGCLIGHLKDSDGRNIEVRHSPDDGYYCEFKNKIIKADSLEDLNNQVVKIMGWKREWVNVIVITGNRRQYPGCPAALHIDLGYEAAHIAQLADGSWVMASWSPNVEIKHERKSEELPNEFTMPCKIGSKYCNNGDDFKIMIPYSEVSMHNLKSYQAMLTDKINALTLSLMGLPVPVPVAQVEADKPEDYDGDN